MTIGNWIIIKIPKEYREFKGIEKDIKEAFFGKTYHPTIETMISELYQDFKQRQCDKFPVLEETKRKKTK